MALVAAWLATQMVSKSVLQKGLGSRAEQKGFVVTVNQSTCWFPFLVEATWDYEVPNVESGRANGWYLLTPWKVYILQQESREPLTLLPAAPSDKYFPA
jgi:hypothetical protein